MNTVYISIGSNIEPEHNIRSSIAALASRFGRLRLSSVYQNPAIGFDGDDFYNLIACFDSDESVPAIEDALNRLELDHGRDPGEPRFSSRPLDLDLVLYGNAVLQENGRQKLPRQEIEQYAFVLGPLAELIPNVLHPVLGLTYQQLWDEFGGQKALRKVEIVL